MLYQLSYASMPRGKSGTGKIERAYWAVKTRLASTIDRRRAALRRTVAPQGNSEKAAKEQRTVWVSSVASGCLFPRGQ